MNQRNILIAVGVVVFLFVVVGLLKKDRSTAEVPTNEAQNIQALYDQAQALEKNGEPLQAKAVYQKILAEHPDYEKIETIEQELGHLNMQIVFSTTPTQQSVVHEVKSGDTLGELAKKYGTTIDLIKKSNNLSSHVIRVGQQLRIWTGKFNIFVDKSQNVLMLKDGEEVLKVYDVSTGKDNNTPVGEFTITTKLVDPVWFNRGVVVPPESPENVLGSRWLGFDLPGYGIHGTVEPQTIGQQVTAGCVRMKNEDVEELYSLLPIGTKVAVAD